MAEQRINPTRMELLRLRKRLKLAQKGHKLLQEKRDGLMQEFLKIVRGVQELRREVDTALAVALKHFGLAEASMVSTATGILQHLQMYRPELIVSERNVMGVRIPQFDVSLHETGERYNAWETSAELDVGMYSFKKVLPKLLALAAIEKSAQLLAQEIEKTRRRVNALEYVLIPQLRQTTRYIRMKLEEQERAAIVTIMAVKKAIQ